VDDDEAAATKDGPVVVDEPPMPGFVPRGPPPAASKQGVMRFKWGWRKGSRVPRGVAESLSAAGPLALIVVVVGLVLFCCRPVVSSASLPSAFF
jgi:hypothetical protein